MTKDDTQNEITTKKNSLTESIRKTARKVALGYFECNSEEVEEKILLHDGRMDPNWLDDGYCDQVSETLYGDSQADDIIPDDNLFSVSEYEGQYGSGNMWNLLNKYFDEREVDEIFYEEWHKLLVEKYGEKWRTLS